MNSNNFDYFVPVYDVVPETWEEGREFLVEQLRRISNGVNARVIGFYVDEEVLAGKSFIPGALGEEGTEPQFRTVLRKVIDVSPLVAGVNPTFAHGITIDANFTLIDLWVSATDSGSFTSQAITGNDVTLDATDILINSPGAFDRAFCFIEYIQEL